MGMQTVVMLSFQAAADECIRVVGKVPSGLPALAFPAACQQASPLGTFASLPENEPLLR